MVSERAACSALAAAGLSRARGRRLLGTGIAGAGQRIGNVVAYDAGRVATLLEWPQLGDDEVCAAHRLGVWVGRSAVDRPLDVTGDPDALLEQMSAPWRQPWLSAMILNSLCHRGPMPFVVAVSGYLVAGADLRHAQPVSATHARLVLEPPGAWWARLTGHRLPPGRGAPPLQRWEPRRTLDRTAREDSSA